MKSNSLILALFVEILYAIGRQNTNVLLVSIDRRVLIISVYHITLPAVQVLTIKTLSIHKINIVSGFHVNIF